MIIALAARDPDSEKSVANYFSSRFFQLAPLPIIADSATMPLANTVITAVESPSDISKFRGLREFYLIVVDSPVRGEQNSDLEALMNSADVRLYDTGNQQLLAKKIEAVYDYLSKAGQNTAILPAQQLQKFNGFSLMLTPAFNTPGYLIIDLDYQQNHKSSTGF